MRIDVARAHDAAELVAFRQRWHGSWAHRMPSPEDAPRFDAAHLAKRLGLGAAPAAERTGQTWLALDGGEIVGECSLSNVSRGVFQSCTIGWTTAPTHEGRGVATTLARHAIGSAFDELGLHRVEAAMMLDNPASERIAEKLGMHRIGISRRHVRIAGAWEDHVLYANTVEDWK